MVVVINKSGCAYFWFVCFLVRSLLHHIKFVTGVFHLKRFKKRWVHTSMYAHSCFMHFWEMKRTSFAKASSRLAAASLGKPQRAPLLLVQQLPLATVLRALPLLLLPKATGTAFVPLLQKARSTCITTDRFKNMVLPPSPPPATAALSKPLHGTYFPRMNPRPNTTTSIRTLCLAAAHSGESSRNNNNNNGNQQRSFATKASRKKKKRKQKERAARRNEYLKHVKKLKRQKNLHPAGKMKRILSAADFWFSKRNLSEDYFLRNQLILHQGYVPLTTLLTFPKFQHWTDLKLLYDAFTNPAAEKRYKVIIDPNLIQHGEDEEKRLEQKRQRREQRLEKREKQRQHRHKQREKRREKREQEILEELLKQHRPEFFQSLNENFKELRAEILAEKRAELAKENSFRGVLERQRANSTVASSILDSWEWAENVEEKWDLPAFVSEEDEDADYYDDEIVEDFELFSEAQERAYEEIGSSSDEEDEDDLVDSDEEEEEQKNYTYTIDGKFGGAEDKAYAWHNANDLHSALVGHKRVSLNAILQIQDQETYMMSGYDWDSFSDDLSSWDDKSWRDDGDDDEEDDDIEDDANDVIEAESAKSKMELDSNVNLKPDSAVETTSTSPRKMQHYETRRDVTILSTPKKLAKFCRRLQADLKRSASLNDNNPDASAIGFDVEYATLELDIRNTMPAMVQLSGPTANSVVGLIWLDKFPDHGRGMLGDESVRPFLDILADSSILKVGVGSSKDAKHLASWWGVNDVEYVGDFIAGVVEIADEVDGDDETLQEAESSLAEICEAVLERRLPKRKQKVSGKNKKRKQQGKSTPRAHWRVSPGQLTKEMKAYAANDAASGIDIWMKLKGLKQE